MRAPIRFLCASILAMIFLSTVLMTMAKTTKAFGENLNTASSQESNGPAKLQLSDEAIASIADLDDHPVEDTDAQRADRMLAALAAIPEDERHAMDLDVELMQSVPLAERLLKLEELWTTRQQELREAYEAMPKVNEILTRRIDVLRDDKAPEPLVLEALADLEDLLSDIDMARDFHTLGGLPPLTSMLLTSRTEAVREAAAWALGTAIRNEAGHQSWVLEADIGSQSSALTLLLENAVTAESSGLRAKVAYALSASLGNNSKVQLEFGVLQGEAALSQMFDAAGSSLRVKIKTLTIMSDLLHEAARGSPAAALAAVPVGISANSGGQWCDRADEALQSASSLVEVEKALQAISSFAPSCRDRFGKRGTKQRLESLAQQCRTSLQESEEYDRFHEDVAQQLQECAQNLR